jgi:histone H3/H4
MSVFIHKTDNGVHVANEEEVEEEKAKANEADQEEEDPSVARLMEMGFGERHVRDCLSRAREDFPDAVEQRAVELLTDTGLGTAFGAPPAFGVLPFRPDALPVMAPAGFGAQPFAGSGFQFGGSSLSPLRDNIQGLETHWLAKLASEADIARIDSRSFEELRGVSKFEMENIIRDAVTFSDHERRKEVTPHSVLRAVLRHMERLRISKKTITDPRALASFLMHPFVKPTLRPGSPPNHLGSTVQLMLQDHILKVCLPPAQAQLRTLAGDGSPTIHLHWMEATTFLQGTQALQIYRVLKQVHPDTEITEGGMATAVCYVKHMCHALTMCALELAQQAVWPPKADQHEPAFLEKFASDGGEIIHVTSRTIQTAARLVLPGELAKHAVSEGTKAVTKHTSSDGALHAGASHRIYSHSERAGLQFEVDAVQQAFFEAACGGADASLSVESLEHKGDMGKYVAQRIFSTSAGTKSVVKTIVLSEGAPVYLAAVLEYLVAELLELGGNAARDNRMDKIIPRHLELAIRNDEELNSMTPDTQVTYYGAGVLPNIHAVLLPRHGQDTYTGWLLYGQDNKQPKPTQDVMKSEDVMKSKHSPHAEGMDIQEQEELDADLAVTKVDMIAGGGVADDLEAENGYVEQQRQERQAEQQRQKATKSEKVTKSGSTEEAKGDEERQHQPALLYRSRAAFEAEKPAAGDVAAAGISLVGAWKLARRAGIVQIARVDELAALLDRIVEALLLPVLHLAQKLPQQHTPLGGEPTNTEVDASSLNRAQLLTAIRSAHGYSVWGSERGYTYNEKEEEWERQEHRPMLGRTFESLNMSERARWEERRNTPVEHAARVRGVRSSVKWRSADHSSEDEEDGGNSDAEHYDTGDDEDYDEQQQWEQEQEQPNSPTSKRSISIGQVRLAQHSEGLLLSKHAFQRKALALLRSLPSQEKQPQQWISAPALGALQVLAENVLVGLLADINLIAIDCKCQTVAPEFLSVALQFRNPKLAARVEGRVHPYLPSDTAPWEQCDELKKKLPAASLTAANAAAVPPNPPSDAAMEARAATSEPSAKDADPVGMTGGEAGETITVKFIRLSGEESELVVNVAEMKTVGELKKGYEKVHGVSAACQILLNMDFQEGEDEAAEMTDEKELSGLSDELSLEAAHISDGTSLSLSIEEWVVEVYAEYADTNSSYVISSTQLGADSDTMEKLEQRKEEKAEQIKAILTEEQDRKDREDYTGFDEPSDGHVFWSHKQEPEAPEKKQAWDKAVVHVLEKLTNSTTDELVFDRPAFECIAREIGHDFKTELTWSEHAVAALQLCVEAHLKQVLRRCNSLAALKGSLLTADNPLARELRCSEAEENDISASDRGAEKLVSPKEIQLARRLCGAR